jgi:hypothetical protein
MTKDSMPFLEAWRVMLRDDVSALQCLAGLVTGHPLLPGRRRSIRTSPIESLDLRVRIARTQNRLYRLGPALDRCQPAGSYRAGIFAIEQLTLSQPWIDGAWHLARAGTEIACFPNLTNYEAIEAILDAMSLQVSHWTGRDW